MNDHITKTINLSMRKAWGAADVDYDATYGGDDLMAGWLDLTDEGRTHLHSVGQCLVSDLLDSGAIIVSKAAAGEGEWESRRYYEFEEGDLARVTDTQGGDVYEFKVVQQHGTVLSGRSVSVSHRSHFAYECFVPAVVAPDPDEYHYIIVHEYQGSRTGAIIATHNVTAAWDGARHYVTANGTQYSPSAITKWEPGVIVSVSSLQGA